MDYTFPILHLENWFSSDEVSKDAEKRREVQNAIIKLRDEMGHHALSRMVDLPALRFTSSKPPRSPDSSNTFNPTSTCDPSSSSNPTSTSNTFNLSSIHKSNPNSLATKQRGSKSYSQYQNQRFYNHAEEIISSSIRGRNHDAEDEEEYVDEEEEEIDEEIEEEENVEDLEDGYSERYDEDGEYNSRFEEEDEYPEVEDQREYYAEMGDSNWPEGGQHDNDENFE